MPISSFNPDPPGPPNMPAPPQPPVWNQPGASPMQPQEQVIDTNIHLMDIQTLLSAVEIAVQRGAYKAQEMSQLGAIYDKVSGFVKNIIEANNLQQPPQQIPPQPQQRSAPEPVMPMTPPFAPRAGV